MQHFTARLHHFAAFMQRFATEQSARFAEHLFDNNGGRKEKRKKGVGGGGGVPTKQYSFQPMRGLCVWIILHNYPSSIVL